jgi:hypothetical protein
MRKKILGEVGREENWLRLVLLIVIVIVLAAGVFSGGVYVGRGTVIKDSAVVPTQIIKPTELPTVVSTEVIVPTKVLPTVSVVGGASLLGIKYTLPSGWEASVSEDRLLLSPVGGGGYLSLKVYGGYSPTVGRREFYCKTVDWCVKETYFEEMKVGNISGYAAHALDNSGGGTEYFGAKGNKFYIISSYNPPSPNDFEKGYKQVLSSLVF